MSSKSFLLGLTAGLAAGIAAAVVVSRNQEEIQEMVNAAKAKLPKGLSLDELMAQKGRIEEAIRVKADELKRFAKGKMGFGDDDESESAHRAG